MKIVYIIIKRQLVSQNHCLFVANCRSIICLDKDRVCRVNCVGRFVRPFVDTLCRLCVGINNIN